MACAMFSFWTSSSVVTSGCVCVRRGASDKVAVCVFVVSLLASFKSEEADLGLKLSRLMGHE